MMRRPTPLDEQLAWWRDAVNGYGKIVATALDPQPGFYKRKLVSGGIYVPARIWIEQDVDPETGELMSDEILLCEVDGTRSDPIDQWPRLWNNAISEAEFRYMEAARNWAAWHAPTDPAANPRQRLNALETPIRF